LKDTDWTKVFFRTGISQDHTLSLTSGGANMNSFTSFGFFDQEGVLVDSRLKRFNLRNNLTAKSKNDRLNLSTTISLNNSNNDSPNNVGSGAINRNYALGGMISVPYISPDDYTPGEGGSIPVVFSNTPLFLLDRLDTYTRYENEVKALAGVNLSYKLTDNIKYSAKLNTDYTEVQLTRAESPISFNAVYFAEAGNDTPGFQSQSSDRIFTYNIVNQLSFEKNFNEKHNLMVSLFSEYFKAHRRYLGYFQEGLDPRVYFPGDGSAFVSDNPDNDWYVDTPFSDWADAGLLSYFGMLDYDFNSKYGVSSTLRRDASYRFRESNRWATFYSFSGRWNIDKEKFMEDSVFDLLKLRASYGTTGNQRIDDVEGRTAPFALPNRFLDLYEIGSGYGGQNSIYATQTGVSDLRWETITQANIGLDFELFNKRLRGNADVYEKTTTDLFEFMDVPYTSGAEDGGLYINGTGELVNKGIELSLNGDVIKQVDGVNLSLRFVGNYNKVNRFGSEATDVEDGGKLYQYYRYRYIGVNPLNGNLLFLDADDNVTENPDQDLDRVFTDKNRYPDYQGSFGFDFDYKNFFISTTFNYAIGIDRFDYNYQGFHDPDAIGQFRHSNEIMNYWTPENRETNIPSLDASNYSLWGGSDM
ncbi:MAG: SusC/RagA family TonB-linked outer membrane protein, partial [Bacteroidota bacterium]